MSGELSRLSPPEGARKRAKHKGRGIGSGDGKTAGRGMKGQKARKSGGVRPGFEGGQMTIYRRLPKRGFKNPFQKEFVEVRLAHLNRFEDGATVDEAALREAGLIGGKFDGIKVIGNGELSRKLTLKVHRISAGARGLVEQAGGTVDLIPDRPKWRRETRKDRRAQSKG
jgi:large subunit ribosomal protein L15